MNKMSLLWLIATLSATLLGCDQQGSESTRVNSVANNPSQPSPAPEKVTLDHANGTSTVKLIPQRIITMDFGALDTLDSLGFANNIIAVPKSNIPTYLQQYQTERIANIGTMKEPNLDLIRQLKPDLIIINGRQAKSYHDLALIAPTLDFSVNLKAMLDSIKFHAESLGKIVNQPEQVAEKLSQLEQLISQTQQKTQTSPLTALVVIHNNDKLGAANSSSYATIIHEIAGVKRADNNTEPKRQAIDEVYLAQTNPDIIFIIDRSAAIGQGKLNPQLLETEAFKQTKAYKNQKIITLTPDLWYLSGGGLESLTLQLNEVTKAFD